MNKTFKPNYLSRDFASIKEDLKRYAQRYYPNTMGDMSEASINTFLVESVAYVGDILSYYLDYQTNESFLATAVEGKNILSNAKSLGYKAKVNSTASGKLALYIFVPDKNGPDYSVMPIIKKGTQFSSTSGASYILAEDVEIKEELIGKNWVVAKVNNVGRPLYYAVKLYVPVLSGRVISEQYRVEEFSKFYKLFLRNSRAVEIMSIVDTEGNYYYEVPNLSQNTVYISVYDPSSIDQKYMLKPIFAQRRFIFDYEDNSPYILFGAKQYNPDDDLEVDAALEPNKFLLNKYNNDYLTDGFFEPNKLIKGDGFGVGPENTILTITYRINENFNSNADRNTVTQIQSLLTSYSQQELQDPIKATIINSIQVNNEEQIIGDSITVTVDEIRDLGANIFSSQSRAVTAKDYETLCYMMPQKFGSLKRVKVERDPTSLKNNINIYTICENSFGNLVRSNSRIKENLKTWISQYKILTDSVDLLDAKPINLGIHFVVMIDPVSDKTTVLNSIKNYLVEKYSILPQIGEPFNILDVYRHIRRFKEVLDIKDVKIINKAGGDYSSTRLSIDQNLTLDKTLIKIPKNAIYEIKIPNIDITGDAI